ncbi:C-X-C chemokine receptor type 2 [Esox lucius]|uniref:G-protein coupled receptors family 1 profile domain-containing protein n=1 Tax=Esox lucius TaxID=8010 RepID=A0AAY5KP06_ESOLU|nr:C-X-C chemokine receptor type 2 [Esox lucius]
MAEHQIFENVGNYIDENYTYDNNFSLNLDTFKCSTQILPTGAVISLVFLQVVIFLLAVPGNLLVGLVIVSSRQLLTSSDIYLFHLMIADVQLALTVPFWAAEELHGWIFGDFMCKFLNLIRDINFYTSILFLVCISVDRYLAIVHTAQSRKARQMGCSWIICASVWGLGITLSLPALFNKAFLDENGRMLCTQQFAVDSATDWRLATRGLRHIVGFLLPLTVMVTCYGVTVARLLRTRCFQKHRAMRVIVAVVIAFLLCWTPYHLTMIADTLIRAKLVPYNCAVQTRMELTLHVTHNLALLHSCVNPVLYAFVGEKFRRNLVGLIQKTKRLERGSASRYSRSTSQTSEGNRVI